MIQRSLPYPLETRDFGFFSPYSMANEYMACADVQSRAEAVIYEGWYRQFYPSKPRIEKPRLDPRAMNAHAFLGEPVEGARSHVDLMIERICQRIPVSPEPYDPRAELQEEERRTFGLLAVSLETTRQILWIDEHNRKVQKEIDATDETEQLSLLL